jgi:hypothetical protein
MAGNIAVLSGAPRFRVGLRARRPQKQNLFLVATAQSTNGFINAAKKVFRSFSQQAPKKFTLVHSKYLTKKS